MELSALTYPDGHTQPDAGGRHLETYQNKVLQNPEICNNCFTRVREVGDLVEITKRAWTLEVNEFFERTTEGSQEHDPHGETVERFGRCYCLNCGSDLSGQNHTVSVDTMTERAKRLVTYLIDETEHYCDGTAVGRTIRDLKGRWENQGYDTEIYAVAIVNGLRHGSAKRGSKQPATA